MGQRAKPLGTKKEATKNLTTEAENGKMALADTEGPAAKPMGMKEEVTKCLTTEEENFAGATVAANNEGLLPCTFLGLSPVAPSIWP